MELAGKVVVVTGAASGIGEACAVRFAEEGARVVVTDRDAEGVARVAAAVGGAGLAGDVTVEDDVRAVADLARATYGAVDLWYSNAGIDGERKPGDLRDNSLWEAMWGVHVMSHVYAARAVLPEMLERGDGYLLMTASLVALTTDPANGPYSVTKHAGLALSEWLAASYRHRGIKVSCFCPGAMRTPMLLAHEFPADSRAMQAAMEPAEVAALLVEGIRREDFLITDAYGGIGQLAEKVEDYDGWVGSVNAMFFPEG